MSWIQTHQGIAFDVLQPKWEQVSIYDIGHALANQCRFIGHCDAFYSVAQHSVLVSRAVPPELQLQALLRDAPKAYCGELNRPLKHTDALAGYRAVEERIWRCVAVALRVPLEVHAMIKHADMRMLVTEQRDLLGPPPRPWTFSAEPYPERIEPVGPKRARAMFFDRYEELTGKELLGR